MPLDPGLQTAIDNLIAKTTAATTVEASATVALSGSNKIISDLTAQLAAAVAANDPTAIAAASTALTAAAAALDTNTQALVAAIPVNTPPAARK